MADSPKEAEAAQALFCAVVDYEGKKISPIPPDYDSFYEKYERTINRVRRKVVTPGVSLANIDNFLTDDLDWYNSSVNVANTLFDETKRIARATHNKIKPAGIDLFYVRDDRNVFNSISTLFTYVNKRVRKRNSEEGLNDLTFNNLNKWSPADIYLSSAYAQRVLKGFASGRNLSTPFKIGKTPLYSKESLVSFAVFNAVIKNLMDSGDLLPLSLKKTPNRESTVIKTINYVDNDVSKALEAQNIGYHGYLYSKSADIFGSKDIYIKFTTRPKIMMQFRDKASSGGGIAPKWSWQGIIVGGTQALDGGLAGGSISDVLGTTSPVAGRFFKEQNQARVQQDAWDIARDMNEDIEQAIENQICDQVFDFVQAYRGNNFTNTFRDKLDLFEQLYAHPNFNIGSRGITTEGYATRARAQFIYAKYLGGRMIQLFEGVSQAKANEMVTNMVLYAGSRTSRSSPHFKASDISSF